MSETLFNSSHPPNIQAPTSQQQADKAKILNDLCQFHLTKLQNLQAFRKTYKIYITSIVA